MDEATRIADKLIQTINKLCGKHVTGPSRHAAALKQLAKIFNEAATDIQCEVPEPIVTSHDPTNPKETHQAPRTHNCQTWNTTPGVLPTKHATSEDVPTTSEGE